MATRSQESRLVIRELSHSGPRGRRKKSAKRAPRSAPTSPITVGDLITRGARRLSRSKVFYGHGTDNAVDDSAALVFHALSLSHESHASVYRKRVSAEAQARVEALVTRRIDERIPAVYLTNETWFAG